MRLWITAILLAGFFGVASAAVWAAEEPADAARKTDPAAADAAYTERLKEIRLIEIRHLRPRAEADYQEARRKILAIDDDAAIPPMVSVLYGPNARYRALLIEALSQRAAANSKVAQAYLQEIAVGDGSQGHRRKAVDGLKGWSGDRPTDRLLVHLARDEVPVARDRAATALATLDEKRAVWLLVERLVTEDVRLVGVEVYDCQVTLDIRAQQCGIPTFRTYPVTAAAGLTTATFTVELPQVQVVDVATTIGMTDKRVVPDYQRVQTQHPDVLAALRALTGKDFGYNQAAWQKWLQSPDAAKTIPPWQPMTFKAE